MDQKWNQILVILVFFQKMTSGAGEDVTVTEGQSVEIKCHPNEMGTMIVWFRVLDNSGMEFIASFTNSGSKKSAPTNYASTFSHAKMDRHILTLQSFNKARDSGIYTCASIFRASELKFGKVTRLVGEKAKVAPLTTTTLSSSPTITTEQKPCEACECDSSDQGGTSPSMFCAPVILGSLAGGCGLLLLLLLIITLYCNRIRTRKCPHHYKRKQRTRPPGKQMVNRHV